MLAYVLGAGTGHDFKAYLPSPPPPHQSPTTGLVGSLAETSSHLPSTLA